VDAGAFGAQLSQDHGGHAAGAQPHLRGALIGHPLQRGSQRLLGRAEAFLGQNPEVRHLGRAGARCAENNGSEYQQNAAHGDLHIG
jgi:hypothetical protein